jgi:hypothetical protein
MHKSATKYNETLGKWCKNKHGASKIIDMFETYQAVALATLWCGCLLVWLRLSFGLRLPFSKIGTSAFISSNSENISRVTFLKHKNSRKQELALWHLINRLVPENA